jgi:hypothetical protein
MDPDLGGPKNIRILRIRFRNTGKKVARGCTADDIMFSCAGKKGKKKGQTLNLTEFLGGDGGAYRAPGSGATTTVAVSSTWADEMDEAEVEDSRGYRQQQVLSLL